MKPADFRADVFYTASADETAGLGKMLAGTLKAGSVVALSGGLGAGKTIFAKGMAKGLGIEEEVTSPTYTIVSTYEGRHILNHIDAYRVPDERDFYETGGRDIIGEKGISVIEWPEHIRSALPSSTLWVVITILDDGRRRIQIESPEHGRIQASE
ncbi:MAG: tRNA (adenosine(37)-N6)-threonylcarbamoyltransferase complex ATPase subunit type 1 TsaE [Treponema sp.]|jgi:tRNA threonylcarbamoyladenosine biosynthesis protein TsaE|nr:tRNA (adenosine(37)-N6)-threonylcarbamoyltransferase complex ATPase subunit type 1 TsaE [Treponema sp.]